MRTAEASSRSEPADTSRALLRAVRLDAPLVQVTMANAFFTYATNCLIDTDHGIIGDVDARRSNKAAEVGAMRKMRDRTDARFGVTPDWIAADTAQGSAGTLVWLTLKRKFLPFIVTVS